MDRMNYQYRLIKRDGELVQQRREIWIVNKSKWWKPWEAHYEIDGSDWFDTPILEYQTLRKGDRVKVVAGFNVGAVGGIEFIEPRGTVWVTRDGSKSPVYYHKDELELIWRPPSESV